MFYSRSSKKKSKKSKKRKKKSKRKRRKSSSSSSSESSSSSSCDEWVEKDVASVNKNKNGEDNETGAPIIGPVIPESIQLGALAAKSDAKLE